jgi:serine/threonine protein kinase
MHPRIVTFLDSLIDRTFILVCLCTLDRHPCMQGLNEWVSRMAPDFPTTIFVLLHVVEKLQKLHSLGLCHRDLKPANILWRPQANAWTLMDFGCAATLGALQSCVPIAPGRGGVDHVHSTVATRLTVHFLPVYGGSPCAVQEDLLPISRIHANDHWFARAVGDESQQIKEQTGSPKCAVLQCKPVTVTPACRRDSASGIFSALCRPRGNSGI